MARDEQAFRDHGAASYDAEIPEYQTLAEWAAYDRLLGPSGVLGVDLGCGTGRFTSRVASRFSRVVGIDFSMASVLIARRRSTSNCVFVVADAQRMPLRSSSVEGVLSAQLLEHMVESSEAQEFFLEIARLLRPGGRAVISTYALSLLDRLLGRRTDLEHMPRNVRWSWRELQRFCARAGLDVLCLENFAVFSRFFAAGLRRALSPATLVRWDGVLRRLRVPWAALTVVCVRRPGQRDA
jgi:SAM-dependent methyltransferase